MFTAESGNMDGLGGSSQRYRDQDREIEQRYAKLLTPIRDLTEELRGRHCCIPGPVPWREQQFMMHEDMELADNLDDLPTPRQAARNQAAAQRNQFRRQRRRPLAMVVFDTEKEDKLYDLKDDVVGYRVDYRLYNGVYVIPECQDVQQDRAREESASRPMSPAGSILDMADDCGPASPLPMPEEPEMVPFCGDIGAFEECPAKPDVEEAPTLPVPPVRQSNLARRIKEERIKNEVIGGC
ncbi:hypothetical protein HPB50_024700 [Hyalomma asiaticum]|uniref:Uncharacterized protein n=1 Tax=Hyalomma asiaticum TaxID=266040 RepID=A0ACB7SSP6_HYAAI|nr:hypothetical protein HPB50_024700 [Hyalomma asiaticum]